MAKLLFLDVETTGTKSEYGHSIWSISGIIEIDGSEVMSFDYKMRPIKGTVYDDKALEVGKIDREQIESFKPQHFVLNKLIEIFDLYVNRYDKDDKFILIGYNVRFDEDFLYDWFVNQNNMGFLRSYIHYNALDVMDLVNYALIPIREKLPNMKLETMAKLFDVEHKAHESMSDIRATYEIFKELREHMIYPL